jgi:hypothetical protein
MLDPEEGRDRILFRSAPEEHSSKSIMRRVQ